MSLAESRPITFVITRDRETAEAFYGETLGLRRLPGDDFAAVYDLAGVPLRITEVPDHQPSPHPVLGWEVPDIEAAVDSLAAKGVSLRCLRRHGAGRARHMDLAGRRRASRLLQRSRRQRPQPDAMLKKRARRRGCPPRPCRGVSGPAGRASGDRCCGWRGPASARADSARASRDRLHRRGCAPRSG